LKSKKKPVFESKNPVFGSKVWKKFGESSETGFSECLEFMKILEIVLFQTLQKLQKNYVELQLQKSQKNSFRLENQLKSSVKSFERRALEILSFFNNGVKISIYKISIL